MGIVRSEAIGTHHVSFSSLTQGRTEDPDSVADSQGRRIFPMKEHPDDWIENAKYDHLVYNGLVMLDHKNNPVRDVLGLS